jgi:hypothetical protein
MKLFKTICLAAVTACLAFLVIELGLLARDGRRDLNSLSKHLDTLAVTANQTAVEARDASTQAKLAAIEQRAYWQKTSLETYKTMASLRLTIVRTDGSLNDQLAPRLALALDNTNKLAATAAGELQKTIDSLQPTLANLATASTDAARVMNDPAIHEALAHVDETSSKAAVTAAEAAQIAGHLNDAATDFAAYVHRLTMPARGIWTFAKELLGLAAQARQAGGI